MAGEGFPNNTDRLTTLETISGLHDTLPPGEVRLVAGEAAAQRGPGLGAAVLLVAAAHGAAQRWT